ncbi:MAG TPA: bifunctional nuclease family protein [Anaerolineae bacterium]|nr:bifunctional nuclease family protein [Anaerolineae bacterium]
MIEVTVDSIKASLTSQYRVVILKELDEERYLPIWIGPFEADAIAIGLQGIEVARPLTHDLLNSFISAMGAKVSHVLVDDLRNDTFYARIIIDNDGQRLEIDSRPSDAIALAVRAGAPIFVAESVMEKAGIRPEEEESESNSPDDEKLSAFRDFLNSLDLDDPSEE